MENKTLQQLRLEIESLQAQLKARQQEDIYNEPARQLAMIMQAFINNGFTEEQAYELIVALVKGGV